MPSEADPIRVNVDLTNPGQFFACCGLFELADRLWPGVEAWFENGEFLIRMTETHRKTPGITFDVNQLKSSLRRVPIESSVDESTSLRIKTLKNKKKSLRTPEEIEELFRLSEHEKDESLRLGNPFSIELNWWNSPCSGIKRFKTWGGRQGILELAKSMHSAADELLQPSANFATILSWSTTRGGVPLYFDSSVAAQAASLDVGFSLDAVHTPVEICPLTELLALIGIQRCRAFFDDQQHVFKYAAWSVPIPLIMASPVATLSVDAPQSQTFMFSILLRTQYLKGFLPAIQL